MSALPQSLQFEEVTDAETGVVEQTRNLGGRPPGSKNRIKTVEEKLDALGCDPILKLATLAIKAETAGQDALAGKLYAELAQYCAAKKKSVEISVQPDSPLDMALQLSSAERMLRVQALMAQLSK